MRKAYWVILILLIIGGLVYFGSKYQVNQQVQNPTTISPGVGGQGGESAQVNVKEFTIEGKPFSFTPNEIRVKEGDTVRINFRNMEGFHDWTLDEFNVKTKQIQAGEVDTVEFVANKKGTFEFYCSVGNHRQMGMVGKFLVE